MANCPAALQSSRRIQRSSASVNPSRRCGYTVRMPFSVRQVKWFFSQTQISEDNCNCPDNVVFRLDSILDKASRVEEVQPFGHQSTLSGRSGLNMKIVCSWSATVRMLGQHRLDAWATPSRCCSIQERISSEFGKSIIQLSVRPPSATVRLNALSYRPDTA